MATCAQGSGRTAGVGTSARSTGDAAIDSSAAREDGEMTDVNREVAIERHPVASENIAGVGYDQQTRTLEVMFTNGSVYRYSDVEPEIVAPLLDPPGTWEFGAVHLKQATWVQRETLTAAVTLPNWSTGRWFNLAIKAGPYEFERLAR